MKKIVIPLALLVGLGKKRPATRYRKPFWLALGTRLCLFALAVTVLVVFSERTVSANIDQLIPSEATAGGPAFNLRILGRDFDQTDRVLWNSTPISTTFISSIELNAEIPASFIASPGIVVVALVGYNSVNFTINPAVLACAGSISPRSQSFSRSGGTGIIGLRIMETLEDPIDIGRSCLWSVEALPPTSFVTITSFTGGRGSGTVGYSVAPNDSGLFRSEILRIRHSGGQLFGFIVDQSNCPASAYSISPTGKEFSYNGGVARFRVTAPAECTWEAVSLLGWISVNSTSTGRRSGNGSVDYSVDPNEGNYRTNEIDVAGQRFLVLQRVKVQAPTCVFSTCLPPILPCDDTLQLSRSFRDEVLARTPRGQQYTQLYYQLSTEAVQITMLNPMLLLRSAEIIERYKPVIQSMVDGEGTILTQGDLDEIDGFLNSFAAKGSPDLQRAIKGLCDDLRDPLVHSEFRITVKDGPKRDLPRQDRRESFKRLGVITVSLGFCVALLFGMTGRRRKAIRRNAKRILVMALALAGITNWFALPGYAVRRQPVIKHEPSASAPSVAVESTAAIRWESEAGQRFPIQPSTDSATTQRQVDAYGKLPLTFEPNYGQTDSQVKFLSRGNGHSLFFTPAEAAIRLRIADCGLRNQKPAAFPRSTNSKSALGTLQWINPQSEIRNPPWAVLRMKLIGANPASQMAGLDELPGKSNYFIGKDPAKWRTDVPSYAKVKYEAVYPGVDMVYYGNNRELEYDFTVAPGADPRAIRLGFDGADRVEVDSDGDLVLHTAGGELRQRKPLVYQDMNGKRQEIAGRYVLPQVQSPKSKVQGRRLKTLEVGFEVGAYDRSKSLIIDPVLAYSTYLGGNRNDEGMSITVDSAGNAYVAGFTDSLNFPLSGASQPVFGGGQQDAFVAKLNSSGTQLVYSTYLGGNGQDNGTGIAVDSEGNAYITGYTGSTNFPVRNPLQPNSGGQFNAFVVKLNPAGSLLYSTHLGGSGSVGDYGSSITVDSAGNAYVAGVATSPNFPTANAIQSGLVGFADAYVAKLNPSGTRLVYSTYLGGPDIDGAMSIAVDSEGNVYLTGVTSTFPTASPLQPAHGGGRFDAFVAKLNAPGTQLLYSTHLGGSGVDRGFRIAVDSAGNAYVTGDTDSPNFPTRNALQPTIGGSADAFVAKLSPSGTLDYSTYLGGSGNEAGTAIAVDSVGNAYVTGFTSSTNFPVVTPLQQSFGGGSFDGFVAKLNSSGSALDYSSYLGGSGTDSGFGIAADAAGNAYAMGVTDSTNFPTASPLQPAYGGGTSDLFVVKIKPDLKITSAMVSGKHLLVFGSGFDNGAKILLNGEQKKTFNDDQNPTTTLVGKKVGKQIASGDTVKLQVRNSDGTLSNEFSFTRPVN